MSSKICAAIEDNSARRALALWFQNFMVGYIEYRSIVVVHIVVAQFAGCISLDHVFNLPLIDFGMLWSPLEALLCSFQCTEDEGSVIWQRSRIFDPWITSFPLLHIRFVDKSILYELIFSFFFQCHILSTWMTLATFA